MEQQPQSFDASQTVDLPGKQPTLLDVVKPIFRDAIIAKQRVFVRVLNKVQLESVRVYLASLGVRVAAVTRQAMQATDIRAEDVDAVVVESVSYERDLVGAICRAMADEYPVQVRVCWPGESPYAQVQGSCLREAPRTTWPTYTEHVFVQHSHYSR